MHTSLNPYLNFNGNCVEAMKFYNSVFGGELDIQTFADTPQMPVPEDQKNRVIHASLKSGAINIMASDSQVEHPTVFGSNVHLSLNGDNEGEITKYFNALSKGGLVTMPLEKQFWGDKFGMCTDKFGINWMVNITSNSGSIA